MNRELIRDVLRAWVVSGRNPTYHASMQQRVRRDMPVLGRALDALVKGSIEPEDVGESDEDTVTNHRVARIHYSYGVNSGTVSAHDTPNGIWEAIQRVEQETMWPIQIDKIETRTVTTRMSPWRTKDQEK